MPCVRSKNWSVLRAAFARPSLMVYGKCESVCSDEWIYNRTDLYREEKIRMLKMFEVICSNEETTEFRKIMSGNGKKGWIIPVVNRFLRSTDVRTAT